PATESNTPRTLRALSAQGTRSYPKSVDRSSAIIPIPVRFRPIMAPTGALFRGRCALSSTLERIIEPLLLFHVAFLKHRWAESIPDTGVLNGRGRALKSPAFFFGGPRASMWLKR